MRVTSRSGQQPAQVRHRTAFPPEAALRPPLKWAGGKRWQLPLLRPIWEAHGHRRLVEPFCGGLAVALGLNPQLALLNDVNPHLINFYRHVRKGLVIEMELRNSARAYYRGRTRFNRLLRDGAAGSREAAALFYYLNRTGYNGLCRFNQSGGFNVPFGRYRRIAYRTDFRAYREAFSHFTFRNVDFERLKLEPGDFVYADPPYDVPFTHYSRGGFSWADQERTARWLSEHPGPVVLVNQATPRIRELYAGLGYVLIEHPAPRMISCTGDRAPAREVLATRNV